MTKILIFGVKIAPKRPGLVVVANGTETKGR